MAKLTDFMVSRVRAKLVKLFLSQSGQMFYVREITRAVKEEINAVRRELGRMQDKGMVKSETRGNRLYYTFKESYPFYADLLSIVAKTNGLGKEILDNRSKLGFVKFAFVSTRFIKRLPKKPDTVDLFLVGKIIVPQVNIIAKDAEKEYGAEVNYSCMTEEEFSYRLQRKDPFISSILKEPRIMIIGDDTDF